MDPAHDSLTWKPLFSVETKLLRGRDEVRDAWERQKKPMTIPEGRELIVLDHQLWFVVRACALVELGFDAPAVSAALELSSQRHCLVAG